MVGGGEGGGRREREREKQGDLRGGQRQPWKEFGFHPKGSGGTPGKGCLCWGVVCAGAGFRKITRAAVWIKQIIQGQEWEQGGQFGGCGGNQVDMGAAQGQHV